MFSGAVTVLIESSCTQILKLALNASPSWLMVTLLIWPKKKWFFCMLPPAEVQSSMKEFCWSLLCLRINFASLHCIKNEKVYLQNDWRLVAPMQNEPVVSDLLVDTGNPTFCLSAPSSFSLPHSIPAMLFQEIKTVAWHIQPPCTCREIHLI